MSELPIKLRISIWRDFSPVRALAVWGGAGPRQQVLSAASEVQEEVFTWQTREDPFCGISDEGARGRLREALYDRFEPSTSPRDRRVAALSGFLAEAQSLIKSGGAEWTASLNPPDEDETAPYHLNSLLTVCNQIEWLVRVFDGLPGISVSVR